MVVVKLVILFSRALCLNVFFAILTSNDLEQLDMHLVYCTSSQVSTQTFRKAVLSDYLPQSSLPYTVECLFRI